MASLLPMERWVKGLEYTTLSGLLADFRREMERGTGTPVERLEVNGALLLNDLCSFLGLPERERQKVLGRSAALYVAQAMDEGANSSAVH